MEKEITFDEIKEGIHKGVDNAISLYREAELLEKNNYYGRAYTLYHMAIEEASKVEHLVFKSPNIFSKKNKVFYGDIKDFFTKHEPKLKAFTYNSKMDDKERKFLENNEPKKCREFFLNKQKTLSKEMNIKKNNSLYLSYDKNLGKFVSPSDTFNKEALLSIKKESENMVSRVVLYEKLFVNIFNNKEMQEEWSIFEENLRKNPEDFYKNMNMKNMKQNPEGCIDYLKKICKNPKYFDNSTKE
jgi:AbiV family abortive infection protein